MKRKSCDTCCDPIVIYTDGSCKGNGTKSARAGAGIWFESLDSEEKRIEYHEDIVKSHENEDKITNNVAEMTAIIRALEMFLYEGIATPPAFQADRPIEIRSDSTITVKGINEWIYNWKAKPSWDDEKLESKIKNRRLFKKLDRLLTDVRKGRKVELKYCKGHAGIVGNENADRLATPTTKKHKTEKS